MRCTKKKIHFNKTDWKKYEEILSKSDFKTEINSTAELDLAASGLTTTIQNACTAATKSTIMTKPKCIQSIPDELLKMIKFKRKINRSLAKKHSTELRKTYNALTSKIKICLTKLKSENLKTNFLQLEKFKKAKSSTPKSPRNSQRTSTTSSESQLGNILGKYLRILRIFLNS